MPVLASQPSTEGGVQLGLLGSFTLRIDAEPIELPMNAQRLVCFLALRDGVMLRQFIAGSLWGETTERHAAGSLRSALWRLGRTTRPVVEIEATRLRLSPTVAVDVRASKALAQSILDDARDLDEIELDVSLLSVDLLPDWTDDWVLVERENHTQLRLRALEALCLQLCKTKHFGQAVQIGMLVVSAEPLRESAQRSLVTAHLADGNIAAAVKQYDSFRQLLRDELQLEPSFAMEELVKDLRR